MSIKNVLSVIYKKKKDVSKVLLSPAHAGPPLEGWAVQKAVSLCSCEQLLSVETSFINEK